MTQEWRTEADNQRVSSPVTWIILLLLAIAAIRSDTDLEARLEYLSQFALTTKDAVQAIKNSAAGIQSLTVSPPQLTE